MADPFSAWLSTNTLLDPNDKTFCNDAHASYSDFALQHGTSTLSDSEFGKAFKRHRPDVEKMKKGPKGAQRWAYVGFALKTNDLDSR